MAHLGREKVLQALNLLDPGNLWISLTREGSDPATRLIFDAGVSGNAAFMLMPGQGALALVANYDQGHVERLGIFDDIRAYDRSFTDMLAAWLNELAPRHVLLNYSETDHLCDGLTHGQYLRFTKLLHSTLPDTDIASSETILARVRARKTPEELGRITEAIGGSVTLYDQLLPRLHVGQSEREIQCLMLELAQELGYGVHLGDYGGPLVCINRIGLAHRAPGNDCVEEGDLLVLDHGLECRGYYSDLARTIYFRRANESEPPAEEKRAFQSAYDAITAAFEQLQPGKEGWEIDWAARAVHLQNGYPEISHATGHQIGRHVHDGGAMLGPRWERYGQAPYICLEAGNVFTIEPTILQSPNPSMLVEENVVLTEEGATWLSQRQTHLWVV